MEHAARVEPVLRCAGLVRRFGERTAVDGVGFEIAAGERYGLLGPNGSGKTTTISMLVGVLAPDAGSVSIGGHDMASDGSAARSLVGLVPQELALYEDLSASENLRFFGRLQGMGRRRLAERMDVVLGIVGLGDRAEDRVSEFSGGMKRRVNIAIGLLHEPRLLVLDEPTVGVDPQSRDRILDAVEELGSAGMAVLYTTHYMEEAERLCDRVGILDAGTMIAEGTREELVSGIGRHDVVAVSAAPDDLAALRDAIVALEQVVTATETGVAVEAVVDDSAAAVAPIVAAATAAGVVVTGIETRRPNLEAVFLGLTGRALRD